MYIYIYRERERERERDLSKGIGSYDCGGVASPEYDGVDQQAGDSGKSCSLNPGQSAARIPSCSGEISLCSIKTFN